MDINKIKEFLNNGITPYITGIENNKDHGIFNYISDSIDYMNELVSEIEKLHQSGV